MPDVIHSTEQYENNWAEQSHEGTRVRERGMRRFKSVGQGTLQLRCLKNSRLPLSRSHPCT
jgi:transposase-like protein